MQGTNTKGWALGDASPGSRLGRGKRGMSAKQAEVACGCPGEPLSLDQMSY